MTVPRFTLGTREPTSQTPSIAGISEFPPKAERKGAARVWLAATRSPSVPSLASRLRLASSRSRIFPSGNGRTGRASGGPPTPTLDSSSEAASRTPGYAWRPVRASHSLKGSASLAAPSVPERRRPGSPRPSLTHRSATSNRAQGRTRPQGVRMPSWQQVSSSSDVRYSRRSSII